MSPQDPHVSIVIPTLNEEADIAGCLAAVGAQDYATDSIEVLLVDGRSADRTVAVARAEASRLGMDLRVLENAHGGRSTSMNLGMVGARGQVIVRVDARSRIQPEYVSRCVRVLAERPEVGVVGGCQIAVPRSDRLGDRSIARALANRYSTGLARYRRGGPSGPCDTVWMGVFRTADLVDLGGWAPEIAINEDWELCARYRSRGMLVWFEADLDSGYLPRSDVGALAKQYFTFGRAKGRLWATGMRPEPRQVLLLGGPPIAVLAVGLLVRRRGWSAVLVAPGALVVLDAVGSTTSAPAIERLSSASVIATYVSAWWFGAAVGAVASVGTRPPGDRG